MSCKEYFKKRYNSKAFSGRYKVNMQRRAHKDCIKVQFAPDMHHCCNTYNNVIERVVKLKLKTLKMNNSFIIKCHRNMSPCHV